MWGLVPSFGVPLRALLRDALRDLQGFKVWEFLRVHLTGSFKASTRVLDGVLGTKTHKTP